MKLKNSSLSFLYFIFALLISLCGWLIIEYWPSALDFGFSVALVYVSAGVFTLLFLLSGGNFYNPIFLFFSVFCLFIYGKFLVYPLGDMDEWINSSFRYYSFDPAEVYSGAVSTSLFVFFLSSGYFSSGKPSCNRKLFVCREREAKLFSFISIFSFLLCLPYVLDLLSSYRSGGYLALYVVAQESSMAKSFYSLGLTLVLLSVFFCCYLNPSKLPWVALSLLAFNGVLLAILGQRSVLFSYVLFMLWILSRHGKRLGGVRVFLLMVVMVVLSQVLLVLRGQSDGLNDFFSIFIDFLNQQGITFNFYAMSGLVENWPLYPMAQNFIPGVSFVLSSFSDLKITDLQYSHFYSNFLNEELYSRGYGVGWSILMDVRIASNGNTILFAMIAYSLGFAFGKLNKASYGSSLAFGFLVVVMYKLFLLPRAGFNSLFPMLFYCLFFYVLYEIVRSSVLRKAA